jgi:hypothetical protein
MSYDSVAQFAEARAGFYHSWHPPVMAWAMGLFDGLIAGTGLFILFNGALALFAFHTFAQPRRATAPTLLLAADAPAPGGWRDAAVRGPGDRRGPRRRGFAGAARRPGHRCRGRDKGGAKL